MSVVRWKWRKHETQNTCRVHGDSSFSELFDTMPLPFVSPLAGGHRMKKRADVVAVYLCLTSDREVTIWLVDPPPPLPPTSPLPNARHCWRGSVRHAYLLGLPDVAGLSYSSPMGYRSPTWLPQSALAGVFFKKGSGGFWSRGRGV